jgi:CBS domain-containing protein
MARENTGNGSGALRAPGSGLAPGVFEAVRCIDTPQVQREVAQIAPDAPLYEVVNRMWWGQRGTVAVTEGEVLIGALSEDDLLRVVHYALRDHDEDFHAKGASLLIWEELFGDLCVADAMSGIGEIAVVDESATLLEGVQRTFQTKSSGARRRYIFVVDANRRVVRVVSMRDVCRFLIAVYDNGEAAQRLPVSDHPALRQAVREILDLPVGIIRSKRSFGHVPVEGSIEDLGAAMIEKMWRGQRGYVLVPFFDGAPQGICTRRDLLRAARRPYCRIRDLAVANLMSTQVKAASRLITLGGVFKLMAIGGYRHMPLLEPDGHVECVLSMWEGVTLFASPE